MGSRVGYTRIVKQHHAEVSARVFEQDRLNRLSQIMGRTYDAAKMAVTDADSGRVVPVLSQQATEYSCFHQGTGETAVAELLELDLPNYGLLLIDEVESSLHPRVQRRLIRDLAEKCREKEWQVILTTHSPYILAELPPEARAHIMQVSNAREIVYGVSPEFAMTRMDDVPHPECDLFVEDERAKTMLTELLVQFSPQLSQRRCQIIPYGAASVGKALGQMVIGRRFPRPTRVFLDGDQAESPGCLRLPGDDAPERVVFSVLEASNWADLAPRVARPFADVADACARALALNDHHEWVQSAATALNLQGDILWQAMCSEWIRTASAPEAEVITRAIEDALSGIGPEEPDAPPSGHVTVAAPFSPEPRPLSLPKKRKRETASVSNEQRRLFQQSDDDGQE
jgi:predicted ATPase